MRVVGDPVVFVVVVRGYAAERKRRFTSDEICLLDRAELEGTVGRSFIVLGCRRRGGCRYSVFGGSRTADALGDAHGRRIPEEVRQFQIDIGVLEQTAAQSYCSVGVDAQCGEHRGRVDGVGWRLHDVAECFENDVDRLLGSVVRGGVHLGRRHEGVPSVGHGVIER